MPLDFYTFKGDIRPFGNGSVVSFTPDTTLTDLAQGEQVAYGATNRTLVRFQRTGGAGKFVGVSRDSQVGLGTLGSAPALVAFNKPLGVWTTGIHELKGTLGETYNHGDPVFMAGTDTTSITKVAAGGVQIGRAHLPDGSQKVGVVRVPVLIDDFTITQV